MTTTPLFTPMEPEVQAQYDWWMQHAQNCERDAATHEHNLLMHIAMVGSAFPNMLRMGRDIIEQSRFMEQEARDMAYTLLSSENPLEPPFKKLATGQ